MSLMGHMRTTDSVQRRGSAQQLYLSKDTRVPMLPSHLGRAYSTHRGANPGPRLREPEIGKGVGAAVGPGGGGQPRREGVAVRGACREEPVLTVIMRESGAKVQMRGEAAGEPHPEYPRAEIEKLKQQITQPD